MRARVYFRHLRREARGSAGRLLFFILCLAVGVATVVAVASLADGLERGIRGEARQLLAADLAVRGRSPIPDDVVAAVDDLAGSARAETRELLTIVAAPSRDTAPGRSQLVELKAVTALYPFYGSLDLEPARPLSELLDARSTVVAPDLLSRLGLEVGDLLRIGGEDFRITGTVDREPDRIATAMSGGPRVFLSLAGLERADLVQRGSRVTYRLLARVPTLDEKGLTAVADRLETLLPAGRYRIETYPDAQPTLRRGLRRLERFLGLAALLSLLIGGIGIAQTVRAWLAGRMDTIAVLKCLGYRPREVLALYLGQAALLALAGSAAGAVLGMVLADLPTRLLAGIVPVELIDPWQPAAVLRGLGLGLGVSLLFSAPPLLAARRVPPSRVLRRAAEPIAPGRAARFALALVLIGGVFAMAAWQARSALWGAQFVGALIAATLLLWLAARALIRLAQQPRGRVRLTLRHGLAALARPGSSTAGAVVALGLGVLVLLGMLLVERHLDAQLARELPDDAPSAFLIDVQPDQWPGVEALLEAEGAERIDSVPVVMARLEAIDDRPITEMVGDGDKPSDGESRPAGSRRDEQTRQDGSRRWALTREQRLTYLEHLPDDNVIVQGEPWRLDDGVAELSVERDFARSLEVGVGSVIRFDVQGVSVDLTVTSIRTVDWESFGINFYLIAEPGALDQAPHHRVAAARLPPGREQAIQDQLAASYPNVTMIRIRDVLERLVGVLDRLSLGVELLAGLVVLAGLFILAGAIGASAVRRGAEVALYKTLGMTRRQVLATFATEYALIGLVAGTIGTFGGGLLAWLVTTRALDLTWIFEPLPFLLAPLATVALVVLAGLLASLRPLQSRPIEALRAQG